MKKVVKIKNEIEKEKKTMRIQHQLDGSQS
jgi:hypothetical protein